MMADCFKVIKLETVAPRLRGGVALATLLHFSGSTERLIWSSQIEKLKVSNQPVAALRIVGLKWSN
jgi:hypothetical protein